jgi:hypothetical protein
LQDIEIDGTIILKQIFKIWEGRCTELTWLRTGTVGRLYRCGNELLGCMKHAEFLD